MNTAKGSNNSEITICGWCRSQKPQAQNASVKPDVDAVANCLQFYNNVAAILSCAACSTFVFTLEEMHVLHKVHFNTQ